MDSKTQNARLATSFLPPRQARSRDTQNRILLATRALLGDRSFEDITVTDIVRQSRSSVGAFYARFRDKDGLLDHMQAIYEQDLAVEIARCGEKIRASDELGDVVAVLVRFYIKFCRKHLGLLRAILMRQRSGRRIAVQTPLGPDPIEHILTRRREIDHADPHLAATLGWAVVVSTIRERLLFDEKLVRATPVTDAILCEELARVYLAYMKAD